MVNGMDLDRAAARGSDAALRELAVFCAQESISAQDRGMEEMARLVTAALERRGFITRRIPTRRHPAILAECRGRGNRSLLFYNHYDVQPPDPVDQWASPPFQPSVRDGKFFARGAMDDKGHLACRLAAIDAVRDVYGELPCTVKFLIEGEEEIASPNLEEVVRENREALAADLCLWEFGEVDGEGVSMQYLGFRGILYVELSVQALAQDCHSGIWGTLLPNAAWRLNWALSRLKTTDERITIPGFYEKVVPPSDLDMDLMSRLPVISDAQRSAMGARDFVFGFSSAAEFHKHAVLSPSCTICGITAGYQGSGQKTIVPARASAKVDFRLVPDQTPGEILDKLRRHLDAEGFGDIAVACIGKINPSRTPVDHPYVAMVAESARDIYGQPQRVYPMSGGSGPADIFRRHLGVPVLTAGVGYLGSNIHAPNEHIRLEDFSKGVRHTARIIAELGESAEPGKRAALSS
jgi:acetylornithine deacetylase/succinyl-diaminopimelate desuccinylase-like protein